MLHSVEMLPYWNIENSNIGTTYRSKRARDIVGNLYSDEIDHAGNYNIDLAPIKRLRIHSMSPLPEFPNLSLQNSFQPSSNINRAVERAQSQEHEMQSPTRGNDEFREDGIMDSPSESFVTSNYNEMNSILGSLHVERMKRMSHTNSSPEESFAVKSTHRSPYNQMNDLHSSDVNEYCGTDSSLRYHQSEQSHGNDGGKAHNSRKQTRLKCDSQLY